jgi:hypothetical protein
MSDDSKYRKPNGDLTPYAFSCGYIQESEDKNVQLCKDGCWHVQARDNIRGRYIWETFPTLTEARKFFNRKSNFIMVEK